MDWLSLPTSSYQELWTTWTRDKNDTFAYPNKTKLLQLRKLVQNLRDRYNNTSSWARSWLTNIPSSAVPLAVDFVLGTETIYRYLKQFHVKEITLKCDLHRPGRTLNRCSHPIVMWSSINFGTSHKCVKGKINTSKKISNHFYDASKNVLKWSKL